MVTTSLQIKDISAGLVTECRWEAWTVWLESRVGWMVPTELCAQLISILSESKRNTNIIPTCLTFHFNDQFIINVNTFLILSEFVNQVNNYGCDCGGVWFVSIVCKKSADSVNIGDSAMKNYWTKLTSRKKKLFFYKKLKLTKMNLLVKLSQ